MYNVHVHIICTCACIVHCLVELSRVELSRVQSSKVWVGDANQHFNRMHTLAKQVTCLKCITLSKWKQFRENQVKRAVYVSHIFQRLTYRSNVTKHLKRNVQCYYRYICYYTM